MYSYVPGLFWNLHDSGPNSTDRPTDPRIRSGMTADSPSVLRPWRARLRHVAARRLASVCCCFCLGEEAAQPFLRSRANLCVQRRPALNDAQPPLVVGSLTVVSAHWQEPRPRTCAGSVVSLSAFEWEGPAPGTVPCRTVPCCVTLESIYSTSIVWHEQKMKIQP